MIRIEAIVRPDRINIIIDALDAVGCRGFNVQNVNGRGQQQGVEVFTGSDNCHTNVASKGAHNNSC